MNNAYKQGYLEGYLTKQAEFDLSVDPMELLGEPGNPIVEYTDEAGKPVTVDYTKAPGMDNFDPMYELMGKDSNVDKYQKAQEMAKKHGGKVYRSYNPGLKNYVGAAGVGGGLGMGLGALFGGRKGALVGGGLGLIAAPALLYLAKRMGWLKQDITAQNAPAPAPAGGPDPTTRNLTM